MTRNIKFVDHIADIAVDLEADSLEELFKAASEAYKISVTDFDCHNSSDFMEIEITGNSKEELLVNFLNEINFLLTTKEWLCCSIESIKIISDENSLELSAELSGVKLNSEIELKQEITKHLGEYMYADDESSLEERVIRLLAARGATLALAEVGSGGSLAAALSQADGNNRVLAGAYTASTVDKLRRLLGVENDSKIDGASGRQQAEQLVKAAADAAKSKSAIAIGPVWRNESGTAFVDVAFKFSDGRIESQRYGLRGSGELARSRLSTQLLDQLRRKLK